MESKVKKLVISMTVEAIISLSIGIMLLHFGEIFIGILFCIFVALEAILVIFRIKKLKERSQNIGDSNSIISKKRCFAIDCINSCMQ